jgi:hypothetical protein
MNKKCLWNTELHCLLICLKQMAVFLLQYQFLKPVCSLMYIEIVHFVTELNEKLEYMAINGITCSGYI